MNSLRSNKFEKFMEKYGKLLTWDMNRFYQMFLSNNWRETDRVGQMITNQLNYNFLV